MVVGLGNPGKEYEKTRHNIGVRVIDYFVTPRGISLSKNRFSSRLGEGTIDGQKILFLFPQTYMNRSGEAVREAADYYKIDPKEILVVHDDIDLSLGRIKFQSDAGPAGHRGVASVVESLGTQSFSRIRMGIGRPGTKEEVESYVLSPFFPEEKEIVEKEIQEGERLLSNWIQSS